MRIRFCTKGEWCRKQAVGSRRSALQLSSEGGIQDLEPKHRWRAIRIDGERPALRRGPNLGLFVRFRTVSSRLSLPRTGPLVLRRHASCQVGAAESFHPECEAPILVSKRRRSVNDDGLRAVGTMADETSSALHEARHAQATARRRSSVANRSGLEALGEEISRAGAVDAFAVAVCLDRRSCSFLSEPGRDTSTT